MPSYLVTHYYHSGFSVACDDSILIFDYWLGENQELNFELGVLASNDLCKEGTYDLKPYKSIIIGYNGQTRKFRLTEETEARVFITENGEPEKYNSLFSPDGAERWVARFVWAEEIK